MAEDERDRRNFVIEGNELGFNLRDGTVLTDIVVIARMYNMEQNFSDFVYVSTDHTDKSMILGLMQRTKDHIRESDRRQTQEDG